MAQQKKGFIARMLEGKERSEEYARSTLPTNRWQLFFDIFKGNFGKIVKVNLLILVFFLPTIGVFLLQSLYMKSNAIIYPFGANLMVGYPSAPIQQGMAEWLMVQNSFVINILLFLSMFIASVGLSGGMYVVRNMVWTEGIFVTNDFWRGVKLNYKNALQTTLFFCAIYFFADLMIQVSAWNLAIGELSKGQKFWMNFSQATSYILIAFAAMMTLWMIAQGVNYKLTFKSMLKNSFLMAVGTFPQTIFFGVIAILPFLFFMFGGSFFVMVAFIALVLVSFAFALLVWLDFAQWVFDKYINPKIKGAKTGRGIYSKESGVSMLTGEESASELEYRKTILAMGKSRLVARPIKPIDDSLQVYELPQSFTREDLQKLRESKQNISEDTELYAEEHKNDLRYVEYNKTFDDLEKSMQETPGKKKRKVPKILGRKDGEE